MVKSLEKFLIITLLLQLLLFPNVLADTSDQPIIASRISEISEIAIIDLDYLYNSTLFEIKAEIEILNRAEENQTVTESQDCYPKSIINASFVDKSLELIEKGICTTAFVSYTYPPGITVEYECIQFYINQKGLTQLPDGNYTLWRPINNISKFWEVDSAEEFTTIITVNANIITIIYNSFYYNRTEDISPENDKTENNSTDETSFLLAFPLVCVTILLVASNIHSKKRIKDFLKKNN